MSLYDEVYGSGAQAVPARQGAGEWTPERIEALTRLEAIRQGVDPNLAVAVAKQESSLKPFNHGDNGKSRGVFHLQRAAAIDAGIDPAQRDDPITNIKGGVTYLKQRLTMSKGDVPQALSRYNRGTPDYRGIGDPDYVYHVMRHYPGHELGKAPTDQEAYRARLNQTFGKGTAGPAEKPQRGLLSQAANLLSPSSAEAATPPKSLYEEVYGAPQPAAVSTAPASTPPPTTPPDASQEALQPSREPVVPSPAGLAMGQAGVQQAVPVTDPAALLAGGRRPPAAEPAGPQPPPASLVKVTADMDDDAILTALGYNPELVKKAKGYTPGIFKKNVSSPDDVSVLNNPLGGIAQGAGDVAYGAVQLGARAGQKLGLLEPADVAFYEALNKLREADYQQNIRKGEKVDPETGEPTSMFADPSRMVGEAIATPIPGLGPAKAGAGLVARAGRAALSAGTSGAISGALQPVTNTSPEPGSPEDTYWSQKGRQTATGGIVGGVAGPVMGEVVTPAVNKAIGAVGGKMEAASKAVVELGEKYGVRVSGPDVTKGPVAPKIENFLENIPGAGVASWRHAQRGEAALAGTGMEERVGDAMQRLGWRNLPAVQRAAASGGPHAEEARWLLQELGATGSDPGAIIQASSKLSLFRDKLQGDRLYDKVETLASPLGNMPTTKTLQAIDTALADVNKQALLVPSIKREVQAALTNLKTQLTTGTPDTSYGVMRQLDSTLGTLQRNAVRPATSTALGQVKKALREDMDLFAQRSGVPELTAANLEARTFWRERVVKYREGQLAKAAAKDRPDEIYDQFVRKGADRAKEFYNGLDPKGQAAVRYQMVSDGMGKALKDPDKFEPGKFVEEMDRLQKATGVFFRGAQGKEITDYTRLMRHITHKGTSPAGLGFTGAAMGGGMWFHPPTLATVLGSAKGLQMLYETKAGRALMLASGRLPPGSPLLQVHLNQFLKTLPVGTAAATSAAQGRQPAPEPEAPEEEETE